MSLFTRCNCDGDIKDLRNEYHHLLNEVRLLRESLTLTLETIATHPTLVDIDDRISKLEDKNHKRK